MFKTFARSETIDSTEKKEANMKFMLFFKGGVPKPQDKKAHDRLWQEFTEDLHSKGVLESGAAFGENGKRVTQNIISDWTPQKDDLTGYMVITASSFDEAVEVAKKAPHTRLGGSTVIRECMAMQPAMAAI